MQIKNNNCTNEFVLAWRSGLACYSVVHLLYQVVVWGWGSCLIIVRQCWLAFHVVQLLAWWKRLSSTTGTWWRGARRRRFLTGLTLNVHGTWWGGGGGEGGGVSQAARPVFTWSSTAGRHTFDTLWLHHQPDRGRRHCSRWRWCCRWEGRRSLSRWCLSLRGSSRGAHSSRFWAAGCFCNWLLFQVGWTDHCGIGYLLKLDGWTHDDHWNFKFSPPERSLYLKPLSSLKRAPPDQRCRLFAVQGRSSSHTHWQAPGPEQCVIGGHQIWHSSINCGPWRPVMNFCCNKRQIYKLRH